MEAIIGKILSDLGTFLFGPIMLAVFFGVGLYFTIRLKGIQFTRFRTAFREVVWNVEKKSDEGIGQIRSYKALATALSSCVGNGNIVGVAYAIAVGGPGAIFWMWIAALGGMATKFAEIALAMHYRVQDEEGNFRGGVMYILTQGMKKKTIAKILGGAFAVFTVFVSFVSCGALQVNTISSAVSGLAGGGTVPGMSASGASRGASSAGTAASSPLVYGWRGLARTSSTGPVTWITSPVCFSLILQPF